MLVHWCRTQFRPRQHLTTVGERAGVGDLIDHARLDSAARTAARNKKKNLERLALSPRQYRGGDHDATLLLGDGSGRLGEVPRAGIFRTADVQDTFWLQGLLASASERLDKAVSSA